MLTRLLKALKTELKTLRAIAHNRLYIPPKTQEEVVQRFHRLYYDSHLFGNATWTATTWLGTTVLKCPLDLWVYQEIFHEVKPDLVVECGTGYGGATHYMACLLDVLGRGRIVSVDISPDERPRHPRIRHLVGSSTAPDIVSQMKAAAKPGDKVLVILDSDHSKTHVLAELRAYGPLVTPGSYVIVEDTNVNGHPVDRDFGPGPWEAVEEYLKEDPGFEVDRSREKFYLTFNPRGYLRRKA